MITLFIVTYLLTEINNAGYTEAFVKGIFIIIGLSVLIPCIAGHDRKEYKKDDDYDWEEEEFWDEGL